MSIDEASRGNAGASDGLIFAQDEPDDSVLAEAETIGELGDSTTRSLLGIKSLLYALVRITPCKFAVRVRRVDSVDGVSHVQGPKVRITGPRSGHGFMALGPTPPGSDAESCKKPSRAKPDWARFMHLSRDVSCRPQREEVHLVLEWLDSESGNNGSLPKRNFFSSSLLQNASNSRRLLQTANQLTKQSKGAVGVQKP